MLTSGKNLADTTCCEGIMQKNQDVEISRKNHVYNPGEKSTFRQHGDKVVHIAKIKCGKRRVLAQCETFL